MKQLRRANGWEHCVLWNPSDRRRQSLPPPNHPEGEVCRPGWGGNSPFPLVYLADSLLRVKDGSFPTTGCFNLKPRLPGKENVGEYVKLTSVTPTSKIFIKTSGIKNCQLLKQSCFIGPPIGGSPRSVFPYQRADATLFSPVNVHTENSTRFFCSFEAALSSDSSLGCATKYWFFSPSFLL